MTEELPAHVETPWSPDDEKNWAADRAVLRDIRKRGEEPSQWLALEYGELDARRKARKLEDRRARQTQEIQAYAERVVAERIPELTAERCRMIADILQGGR